MPDSENPNKRLSNWGSYLGQYGRFVEGEPPGPARDAGRIRQYVLEHYIEPAREEGRGQAEILLRDMNAALGLKEAWPNICQSVARRYFCPVCGILPFRRTSMPMQGEIDTGSVPLDGWAVNTRCLKDFDIFAVPQKRIYRSVPDVADILPDSRNIRDFKWFSTKGPSRRAGSILRSCRNDRDQQVRIAFAAGMYDMQAAVAGVVLAVGR